MKNKSKKILLLLIISFIIPFFIINSQSLWIDEAVTAYFATFPNIKELIANLINFSGSERQMPGYVVYIWSWVKIFGDSEYLLRAANIPFLLLFLFVIYKSNYQIFKKYILILLTVFNPFIWYNLNEARNTVIIFSLYGIIFVLIDDFLNNTSDKSKHKIYMCIILFLSLLGLLFNMLFYFAILSIFIYTIISHKISYIINKENKNILFIFLLLFSFISLYYLQSILAGAGGMRAKPGIKNIIYIFYEFLGFIGIGPPRNYLRSNPIIAIKSYVIPIFSVFILYSIFFIKFYYNKKRNRNLDSSNKILFTFILSLLIFFIVAYLFHFRFWARHISFLLVLIIFYLVDIIYNSLLLKNRFNIILIGFLALSWIYSDFNIRFNTNYYKDNYKGVVSKIIKMNNYSIYFAGAVLPAEYYGLFFKNIKKIKKWPKIRECISISNLKLNILNKIFISTNKNSIIIFKKYDLFDKYGAIRKFIQLNAYSKIDETKDYIIYRKVI